MNSPKRQREKSKLHQSKPKIAKVHGNQIAHLVNEIEDPLVYRASKFAFKLYEIRTNVVFLIAHCG